MFEIRLVCVYIFEGGNGFQLLLNFYCGLFKNQPTNPTISMHVLSFHMIMLSIFDNKYTLDFYALLCFRDRETDVHE